MPGNDQPKGRSADPAAPESPDQSHVSRRSLLGAAGVGAAGLAAGAIGGLAVAAPAMAAAKPDRGARHDERTELAGHDEHVVVRVRAGNSGELDVYSGTSHTRVQDPDLAARLRRSAR